MLCLTFFFNTLSHQTEIIFFGSLGAVFRLSSFVKCILLTLELSFLVFVVLLSFGVSIILLLNHLLQGSSFGFEDIQLILNVQSFFQGRSELIGPQLSEVFKSIREVRNVILLL